MKSLDTIVLGWIALVSLATFLLFGLDKWRARKSGRRISEWHLALISASGGWPGGLLGILLFRHKTSKGSFHLKFCFAFLVFAAAVAGYFHWRSRLSQLQINPFLQESWMHSTMHQPAFGKRFSIGNSVHHLTVPCRE